MTLNSRLIKRRTVCVFNIILLMSMCLFIIGLAMSTVINSSAITRQYQVDLTGPRYSNGLATRQRKHLPGHMDLLTDETMKDYFLFVKRQLVTKADYAMTLTAPFAIENPNICKGNVTVLIIVHTSTDHFLKRSLLRQSIGSKFLYKSKYSVRIAFLLGLTENRWVNSMLRDENEKYGDIIQGEFLDTYHNLTLKGVMGFRWINQHCSHSKFVVKMDDDIFVNIFEVVNYYIPRYSNKKYTILCNKNSRMRIQRRSTKWRVSEDYFRRYKYYPPFCSGFIVLMSTDTSKALYSAAQFTPLFWVDDVYLYGLLPAQYEIAQEKINRQVSLNVFLCRDVFNSTKRDRSHSFIACPARTQDEFTFYWEKTLASLVPGEKQFLNDTFMTESLSARMYRVSDKTRKGQRI